MTVELVDWQESHEKWLQLLRDQERHPSVIQLARWFSFKHLSPDYQVISQVIHETAQYMTDIIGDDAELTAGLRKLLEAKDCFIRAAIVAMK